MNFIEEQQKTINSASIRIGKLAYERYQLTKQTEKFEKRIAEIDMAISDLEVLKQAVEQASRDFDTYLAVQNDAVTLDQLKEAVENGGKE